MNQSDSDSDSEEQDDEKQKKLEEREKLIVSTFYPHLNLRRAGELDKNLLLRRTREVFSLPIKLKTDQNREGNSSKEDAPGSSDAGTETREDIPPLLPNIVPKGMVNFTMQFKYEEESERTEDDENNTQSSTKSGPFGIIDSSFPVKKTEPIEDLQVLKKVAEMQFVVGGDKGVKKFGEKSGKTDDVNSRKPAIIHTKGKRSKDAQATPAETKDEKTDIAQTFINTKSRDLSAEKIQAKRRDSKEGDKSKEVKHEKSDTEQKPVKTDKVDLTEPAKIHTKKTESRKSDEKQTIEIQTRVVSVTKKIEPISTEIKFEKTEIPQTFLKTDNQDIRDEKTKWKEPKKDDERYDSATEKVTMIKKMEIKKEKLSPPEETSTKKDRFEPDTKLIKPETVLLKKEEKTKKYDETPIVKKYDEKPDTPQKTIKIETKEISDTKKVLPISTEIKVEKVSQDTEAEKFQTKSIELKKVDEIRGSTTGNVTIAEKIKIKNEMLSLPEETSTKKETLKPDTKSIKLETVPPKKEEKRMQQYEVPIVKKYDEIPDTPQQTIKTEGKEISVTKKVQSMATKETKGEKIDIPQTFIKTGSQGLRAEKIQSNWKGPNKDEKLDPPAEKVTIIKKIEIKNEKTTLPEKSAKKDASQPDTKSIKSNILPIKKEEKVIKPIKTKEVVKPLHVSKTLDKSKRVEETSMTNLDLVIKPIELIVLVTSTMESLVNCLLLAEKINYRTKDSCKCKEDKEMLTEKEKTKNGSARHTSEGGGRTFYSKISYADKAIQHVMYVIIYARFPNINFFQMEEIKIK